LKIYAKRPGGACRGLLGPVLNLLDEKIVQSIRKVERVDPRPLQAPTGPQVVKE